jgi:hypothetical protein
MDAVTVAAGLGWPQSGASEVRGLGWPIDGQSGNVHGAGSPDES